MSLFLESLSSIFFFLPCFKKENTLTCNCKMHIYEEFRETRIDFSCPASPAAGDCLWDNSLAQYAPDDFFLYSQQGVSVCQH